MEALHSLHSFGTLLGANLGVPGDACALAHAFAHIKPRITWVDAQLLWPHATVMQLTQCSGPVMMSTLHIQMLQPLVQEVYWPLNFFLS